LIQGVSLKFGMQLVMMTFKLNSMKLPNLPLNKGRRNRKELRLPLVTANTSYRTVRTRTSRNSKKLRKMRMARLTNGKILIW
jgi:hypothetical protein